jgi:hypothetical protein
MEAFFMMTAMLALLGPMAIGRVRCIRITGRLPELDFAMFTSILESVFGAVTSARGTPRRTLTIRSMKNRSVVVVSAAWRASVAQGACRILSPGSAQHLANIGGSGWIGEPGVLERVGGKPMAHRQRKQIN